MITVSSGSITTQALISPGRRWLSSFQGRALRIAALAGLPMPTPSASPPAAVSTVVTKRRRERLADFVMVASVSRAHQGGSAMNRAAQSFVGATAADVAGAG